MRIQTPIRMKYAYGAESSGICVKFMPYQPAIRESGKKIAFVRAEGDEYELGYEAKDVNEICNREKGVPVEWITKNGSDVSEEFIRYARPLIQGEVQVPQQDGLPLFAYRK